MTLSSHGGSSRSQSPETSTWGAEKLCLLSNGGLREGPTQGRRLWEPWLRVMCLFKVPAAQTRSPRMAVPPERAPHRHGLQLPSAQRTSGPPRIPPRMPPRLQPSAQAHCWPPSTQSLPPFQLVAQLDSSPSGLGPVSARWVFAVHVSSYWCGLAGGGRLSPAEKETLPNCVGLCFQQRCGDPPPWLFGRIGNSFEESGPVFLKRIS
ncbi:uncharacterized protein [Odocoileus virginianus]|uniref:Uncharacterized protein isoform X2 n=1 Tax=Odocoileus virginianus TaxID=9874 RepID=A0ABM4HEH0_ODOVR